MNNDNTDADTYNDNTNDNCTYDDPRSSTSARPSSAEEIRDLLRGLMRGASIIEWIGSVWMPIISQRPDWFTPRGHYTQVTFQQRSRPVQPVQRTWLD